MKNSCVQWVAKELAIVLPYLSDSDLQHNLRQGWRHAFNDYCDHCSWKKLNNWSQCRSSLRCCNQSVHVYQNCLEQSQKHVCDGANDHYNYSLSPGVWQSFVTIRSCNHLMKIISTYVDNTKKSEISWRWQLFKLGDNQLWGV